LDNLDWVNRKVNYLKSYWEKIYKWLYIKANKLKYVGRLLAKIQIVICGWRKIFFIFFFLQITIKYEIFRICVLRMAEQRHEDKDSSSAVEYKTK
jgi:hypothetical protein